MFINMNTTENFVVNAKKDREKRNMKKLLTKVNLEME